MMGFFGALVVMLAGLWLAFAGIAYTVILIMLLPWGRLCGG